LNRWVLAARPAAGVLVCSWLVFGTPASAQPAQAVLLAGITAADEYPNGCVDCHKVTGAVDSRLPVLLAARKHANITAVVNKVPGDCALCHREGTKAGALSSRTHGLHYTAPRTNRFVTAYRGSCLACHSLDADTGVTRLKIVARNW
jgi:hypothetical protein